MNANSQELLLLKQLLREVELEQFADRIIQELQVSRISHFDYVTVNDLMGVGMGKPAARRLLDAVKRKKGTLKKKLLQTFTQNNTGPKDRHREENEAATRPEPPSLTCLIKETDLKIGPQLGDGSFGIVHKGEWSKPSGPVIAVAVKVLKNDVIQRQEIYEDFVKEVEAMQTLQHPSLIRLHGVVLSQPMMMVTELAPLGSLLDYLHKQCTHISIHTLWQYSTQIASGMAYLESRRLLHRDLACRNIFLTSASQAKLGDFGLLRPLPAESNFYVMTEKRKVPFPWCAPESLKCRQFSHASDVWMFGISLWEMYTFGEEPWAGLSGREILVKIDTNGERLREPESAPASVCNLMQRCWAADPAERPRFADLSAELAKSAPRMVKCRCDETQQPPAWDEPAGAQRMQVAVGDMIAVISGRPDFYWWKGQNQRTFEIGIFPRCWTEPLRRRNGEDISRPLRHSFIHTGHGSPSGTSWGSPAVIDDVYLRNPMEPLDILGVEKEEEEERPAEEPRRMSILPVAEVNKSKRQFNYFRLNEDPLEKAELPKRESAKPREPEEALLIDLSTDAPKQVLPAPSAFPVASFQQPLIPATDRLYANCPSQALTAAQPVESHYYSEVPFEPIPAVPAVPAVPPVPATAPVPVPVPIPILDEESRRKRDEAFSWLGLALSDLAVSSRSMSGSVPNLKADSGRFNGPFKVGHDSSVPMQRPGNASYGFDDDFGASSRHLASDTGPPASNPFVQHRQPCYGQPVYPRPGTGEGSRADSDLQSITYCVRPENAAVQTAHVRPFVVAGPPTMVAASTVEQHRSSLRQIQLTAPWATESEAKQALLLNGNQIQLAIRYLQVEKLYRLGLCSKSQCEKALETTNWDLEKAASALLDP